MVYTRNEILTINESNLSIGIGTTLPRSGLDITYTESYLSIPRGTTAQRYPIEGAFRYNTDVLLYEMYIQNQWHFIPVVPKITGVSTNVLKNINDSVTVYGSDFRSNAYTDWKFMGISNRIYNSKQFLLLNSSNIQLTRPDYLPLNDAPYKLQCRQMGSVVYYSSITVGNAPYYTTPGGFLVLLNMNSNYTPATSIIATDEQGGGILQMTVSSGSIPEGLTSNFQSIGSNGIFTLSGYTSNIDIGITSYPFTVTSIDLGSNIIAQSFSISVSNRPILVATDMSSVCTFTGTTTDYFIISGVRGSNVTENYVYFDNLDNGMPSTGVSSDRQFSNLIIQGRPNQTLVFTARIKNSIFTYSQYTTLFIGLPDSINTISTINNSYTNASTDINFTYTIPSNAVLGNYVVGFIHTYGYIPTNICDTSAYYESRVLYSLQVY
jgi:hypothetical protein